MIHAFVRGSRRISLMDPMDSRKGGAVEFSSGTLMRVGQLGV